MLEKYLYDLNKMKMRNAAFSEYFEKLLDAIDDLNGNDKVIFIYSVMSIIKEIGFKNGEIATKKAIKEFLL